MSDIIQNNVHIKSKKISIVQELPDNRALNDLLLLLTERNSNNYIVKVDDVKRFINKELWEEVGTISNNIAELNNEQNNINESLQELLDRYNELTSDGLVTQNDILLLRQSINQNTSDDLERYQELKTRLDEISPEDMPKLDEVWEILSELLANTSVNVLYSGLKQYSLKIDDIEKPSSVKYGHHTIEIKPNMGYYINSVKVNNAMIYDYDIPFKLNIRADINFFVDTQGYEYKIKFVGNGNYVRCNVDTSYEQIIRMGDVFTIPSNVIQVYSHYKIKEVSTLNEYCTFSISNNQLTIIPNGRGVLLKDRPELIEINKIICTGQEAFILFDSTYYNDIIQNGFKPDENCKVYEDVNGFPIIPNKMYSLEDIPNTGRSGHLYCCAKRSLINKQAIGNNYKWLDINGTYYEFVYEGSISGSHTNITEIEDINVRYQGEEMTILKVWWDNASYNYKLFKFI